MSVKPVEIGEKHAIAAEKCDFSLAFSAGWWVFDPNLRKFLFAR
jgi:hypothetical protein